MSNEKLSAGIGEAAGLRDGIVLYVGQPVSHSMACVSGEVATTKNNVVSSQAEVTSGVRVRQAMGGKIIRWDGFGDA